MSKKRHRETLTVDAELVGIYEDLANHQDEIRFRAAQQLLARFSGKLYPSTDRINEILRRLIRGLCSGRKAARVGFSVALTEVLILLFGRSADFKSNSLSISDFIDKLKEETHPGNITANQEGRDHFLGRLFGAETVINSGVLFDTTEHLPQWSSLLDLIFELAKQKSWLREECGWILFEAVKILGGGSYRHQYVQQIIDKLHHYGLAKTSEGVAIWIAASERFAEVKFPQDTWHKNNPLHQREKQNLALILKEASPSINIKDSGDGPQAPQKGTWASKLHFAWAVILDHLPDFTSSTNETFKSPPGTTDLVTFWDECVDKSLFAATASEERKYWGFLVFQTVSSSASKLSASVPFSKNLMKCLINQLAFAERFLHRIAEKSIKITIARVQSERSMAVPVLECLLSPPNGQIDFDHVTKTNTIRKLIDLVEDDFLMDLVQILRQILIRPGTNEEKISASRRQLVADLLVNVVKSRQFLTIDGKITSLESIAGIQHILSLLAQFAYFTRKDSPSPQYGADNPPLLPATHDMFRARLTSCLTFLTSKVEDPAFFPYHVACSVCAYQASSNGSHLLIDMDEQVDKILHDSLNVLKRIDAKERTSLPEKKALLNAFKLLYSFAILQIYHGDADAVNVLQELKLCYDKFIRQKPLKHQAESEILVEVILSFVAKPLLLFRQIGRQVFSACIPVINEAALDSISQVLLVEETLGGYVQLFDNNDESTSTVGESDAEEIGTADRHVGPSDINDFDSDGISDKNDSSNMSIDHEGDLDDADADLVAFDTKLAEALEAQPAAKDGVVNSDDGSTTDEMNDEQMEALDDQLAKIFRERKKTISKKSQTKEARELVVNFKCRVLELLEIFIKQQHSNALTLGLLLPLLNALRSTKSNLVSRKIVSLISVYSRACKGKSLPFIKEVNHLFEILEAVHLQAMQHDSNLLVASCSQASLLIVRVLAAQNKEHLRRVLSIYSQSQESFLFDPQCRMKTSFFSDWLNWCASVNKNFSTSTERAKTTVETSIKYN